MKLKDLAKKPTLVKVTVDTDNIIKMYGEPLEFWMWDRQDLPTFLQLASLKDNPVELFKLIKDLVLDEDGSKVLGDEMLPVEIMVPVIEAAVKNITNFTPQTSAA